MFRDIHPTKSSLMTALNMARRSRKFQPARLYRAFGLAQSNGIVYLPNGDVEVPGSDTFYLIGGDYVCDCEDFRRHVRPLSGFAQFSLKPAKPYYCKHILCRMLLKRAWDLDTTGRN